ncbi:MAG: cytochrome c-type biogenesis protein [archaeon GW2011_AR9]|nr:MAG: cytochrome c-type biogenesis protein [archaeon GW2011_AR9]MBS3120410.1 cytochrome c biogenesis protein CcdA [Candidatus Woesearchaeota archaeon]HIG93832.1 cytochrome c biogenesis protein CcdA [Candidatus Woesearchaeota archaeon]HIH13411.1 cytochrome c biogenesis protein CcdA [Candidatus Woesearchaeota archaeon]
MSKVILLFVFILLWASLALAANQLPLGLQKIIEYNNQATLDFSVKISFFIAFVAGILGILSPCILPFLPAYFSYTFKEKKNLTLMTLVFFGGFSLVLVFLGVIAGFLGEQSLQVLQRSWLVVIAGMVLIFLGAITLMGKGFSSFLQFHHKFNNDVPGTFLFGMAFALGWTACLGPVLAGILGIGAILGNVFYSALLLFFYALGNIVPLFLLSFFYDRFNLGEKKWMKGKMLTWTLLGKRYQVHSTNLISGLLLFLLGIVMIIFGGTGVVNGWDLLNTKEYFYSVQNQLLQWQYVGSASVAIFVVFMLLLGYMLWRYWMARKNKFL